MQGGSAIVEYNHVETSCHLRVKHIDKSNPNHLAYGIDVLGMRNGSNYQSKRDNKNENESKNESKNENPNDNSCQNENRSSMIPIDSFGIDGLSQSVTIASCSFYDNLIQIWDTEL